MQSVRIFRQIEIDWGGEPTLCGLYCLVARLGIDRFGTKRAFEIKKGSRI
jgi:hypothetical protein